MYRISSSERGGGIGETARAELWNKTPLQTAVDAAVAVKKSGVRVFSWGFGGVQRSTMQQMATYTTEPWAILAKDVADLKSSLALLEAALCHVYYLRAVKD